MSQERGLVLEGGGAKGAYQLGALLALRFAGKRFDIISGSSVGALNGFLMASDQLDFGFHFWWNLGFGKVLAFRTVGLLSILIQPFYWGGRFVGKPFGVHASPLAGIFGPVVGMVTSTVLCGVIGLVPHLRGVAILGWLYLISLMILIAVPNVSRLVGLSAFRPSPLRRVIHHAMKYWTPDSAQRTELIITLTEELDLFDPDAPHTVTSPGLAYGLNEHHAVIGPVSTPRYVKASELDGPTLVEVLLASAALPHGVFPAVRVDGREFIDGGVSDNLPIYSVLNSARLEELVVIRLNPGTDRDLLEQRYQRSERAQRLASMPIETAIALRPTHLSPFSQFDLPVFLKYRNAPLPPTHIVIAPEYTLGNLATGTLNFTRAKSRSLLRQGWTDARNRLGCPTTIPETIEMAMGV